MSRRIAVIDDEPVFLAMLHDILGEEGYEPHAFSDGMAAYEQVRACAPHALVVDIPSERPAVGGVGWALRRFGRDPALHAIPIVVCSAAVDVLKEHAAALDGAGYAILPKPFDLGDLLALLNHMTSQAIAVSV